MMSSFNRYRRKHIGNRTGLSDDSLSEKLWENDEVSDWGGDVDSEVEQDIRNRLSKDGKFWSRLIVN